MTDDPDTSTAPADGARGSVWEVFRAFLLLGVTSFGGPIAHLGYFRAEFVQRRRWLDDRAYADLVALCQFLPGPASSQVGFALGLHRAGFAGALAAFLAFTLPSAVLMVAFAFGATLFDGLVGEGMLAGLTITAVAIVAHAVWAMARTLTPDPPRAGIAVVALTVALAPTGAIGQLLAIALGAAGGVLLCRAGSDAGSDAGSAGMLRTPVRARTGVVCLVVFGVLLVGLPPAAAGFGDAAAGSVSLFDAFYRAGALVFGGGHVVLPLLEAGVVAPGWVEADAFLAGYGAAQAMPGPLFTFAGFLGALSTVGPGGVGGAAIALLAIFLPGFLLLVGVLPFWRAFHRLAWARAAMRGANAAVVGILAAALYTPVFTTAVTDAGAFTLAVVCFVLLSAFRLPPWVVVLVGAAGGVALALLPAW